MAVLVLLQRRGIKVNLALDILFGLLCALGIGLVILWLGLY